jgi:hypothetical protein
MATTGDAPLSLTLPSAGDNISLAVLNANYVAINALADNHEDRLDAVEPLVTAATTAIGSSGAVYNSTRWNGRKLLISPTAPTSGMVEGDIWLKVQA